MYVVFFVVVFELLKVVVISFFHLNWCFVIEF